MADARLSDLDNTTSLRLLGAAITGDNPEATITARSSDIVHTRNGQVISARSWSNYGKWDISFPSLTGIELAQLKIYYNRRVMYLQPTGVSTFQFKVMWQGDFSPSYHSPTKISLDISLVEVV